jgi:5-methylcytosine-specific restriction enzyme subunit McrC
MMTTAKLPGEQLIGRIPVRNLWLLMLYASDLTRIREARDLFAEKDIDSLPDLVARLLAIEVERRLRRNLTRHYQHRELALNRVRGCIDILTTESRQLLSKGEVFCRFEELTMNTARNRLVRSALERMSRLVNNDDLRQGCRQLSASLGRIGVGGLRPSRKEMAVDQIGRNDAADRTMIALARLAFDLALPTEEAGKTALFSPERETRWVYRLFEKAVLGFAAVELEPLGWKVRGGLALRWPASDMSGGMAGILPTMITDIMLDAPHKTGRVVIDTKFSSIVTKGRFGDSGLKSGHLYQMYAYLRSQEDGTDITATASGLLLYPAIHATVNEHAIIQNHRIAFSTVDLSGKAEAIRQELRSILLAT